MDQQSAGALRRQLRFRAWHRGTREMDLILGQFADAYIEDFSLSMLKSFEKLLEATDPDLYDWVSGRGDFPSDINPDLANKLRRFYG